MHKILSTSLLIALSSVGLNAVADQDREAMCHNGKNFEFVTPSVQAHLNHGDKMGTCEDGSDSSDTDDMTAVLMMRCEAGDIVSSSASFDSALLLSEDATSCSQVLSNALNAGLTLSSTTSGSAGEGDSLRMYTDYLLLGEEPEQPEEE